MVVGLGIDLVERDRVASALARWGPRFVSKLMDPEEAAALLDGAEDRVTHVALAIALKEAASKAIGTGWSHGVRWRDVVVALDPAPRVTLHAEALRFASRLGSAGRTRVAVELRGSLVLAEVRLIA